MLALTTAVKDRLKGVKITRLGLIVSFESSEAYRESFTGSRFRTGPQCYYGSEANFWPLRSSCIKSRQSK